MANTDSETGSPTQGITGEGELSNQMSTMTMEEVITATVRTMQLSPTRQQLKYSNKEIAALLPTFSGKDGEDVANWLTRVEAVQRVYAVADEIMQVIMVTKLLGAALEWYYSKVDYVTMSLSSFKVELRSMFASRPSRIALMKSMEARRWRKDEKFSTYFNDKVVLANKVNLDRADVIEYVIDGFDNSVLQSQARMKGFSTLAELQQTMNNITGADRGSARVSSEKPVVESSGSVTRSSQSNSRTALRCFNCNGLNHRSSECSKPRREKGSCYQPTSATRVSEATTSKSCSTTGLYKQCASGF
uniref:CCHC-type domain-containing protein n=1 Tax=Photinus pyralis TaxID=7054 RepID=A0A1Y1MJM7_PHOPY